MSVNGKQSPLKQKPLRYAGQSLDTMIDDLMQDKVLYWFLFFALMIAVTASEFLRKYYNPPPMPWLFLGTTIMIGVIAGFRIWKHFHTLKTLIQGRNGERETGQILEQLREYGCKIYHDIPSTNSNIDHVIICSKGVFAVETKTLSKGSKDTVTFDGQTLTISSQPEKTGKDYLLQAKRQAKWLFDFLQKTTSQKVFVTPIITFPGWWVENTQKQSGEIAVLNPMGIANHLKSREDKLTPEQIALFCERLERHIREK